MTKDIINKLGFKYDDFIDVKGRLSITDLFPKSKARCGIYLLNFSDNTFYIGQAVDVVRRFSQHRKNHDNIIHFWFQVVKKNNLNETETRLIYEAEINGLLLTNKTFVSNIIGETDLDQIVSPEEQNEWIEKGIEKSFIEFSLFSNVDMKHIIKYRQNFETFKIIDSYLQLKRILKLYVKNCIPYFKKTELSFWSLSCLPSTNKNTFPRYFCLNVNSMEVFVIGYERKTKTPFAFFALTTLFIRNIDANKEIERLYSKYKTLEANDSYYRAAGNDQVLFHFSDLDELENVLLTEPKIIQSIKELNLRLMRKGGTIYSPYHCFDLAKEIIE